MAQKRLKLIGTGQLHLAESVQNPLERRKDTARFGAVGRITRKDRQWGVLTWIDRKDPVGQKGRLIYAKLLNVHLCLLFL